LVVDSEGKLVDGYTVNNGTIILDPNAKSPEDEVRFAAGEGGDIANQGLEIPNNLSGLLANIDKAFDLQDAATRKDQESNM